MANPEYFNGDFMLVNEPSVTVQPIETILDVPPLATYLPKIDRTRDEQKEGSLSPEKEFLMIAHELSLLLSDPQKDELLEILPLIQTFLEGKTQDETSEGLQTSTRIFRSVLLASLGIAKQHPDLLPSKVTDHIPDIAEKFFKSTFSNQELSSCEVDYVYQAVTYLKNLSHIVNGATVRTPPPYTWESITSAYRNPSTQKEAHNMASLTLDWFARTFPMPITFDFSTRAEFYSAQEEVAEALGDPELFPVHKFSALGFRKLLIQPTLDGGDHLGLTVIGSREVDTDEFRSHEGGHANNEGILAPLIDEMLTEKNSWMDPKVGLLVDGSIQYEELSPNSKDYLDTVELWVMLSKDQTLIQLLDRVYEKGEERDTYALCAHIIKEYGWERFAALFVTSVQSITDLKPYELTVHEVTQLFSTKTA